jgi:hypothetical protein
MIYGAIWRALPGPRPLKALQAAVLVVAAVALCFEAVFPHIADQLPFNDQTITGP